MALQGTSRDVNIHNADSTTGRKSAGDATTMVLAVEDKAVLDAIAGSILGNLTVIGNVASGSADSGMPIKVGGVYNSILPTFVSGQRADIQVDVNGNLRTAPTPDRFLTGTISALGASIIINTEGESTVGWDTQGTWVGTLTSEISYDGITWYQMETINTGVGLNLVVYSFTETANNNPWITNVAGSKLYRLRATAWTSGTATINFNAAVGTGPIMVYQTKASSFNAQVVGASSAGTIATPKPLVTGGVDGTGAIRYDRLSASGHGLVDLFDGAGTALTSSLVNARQALDIHQADTSFIVSGLTSVGLAPVQNPVSVSGVDGGGLKRHLLTDTTGKLSVIHPEVSGATAAAAPAKAVYVGGKNGSGNLQGILMSSVSTKQQVVSESQIIEDVILNKVYSVIVDSFNLPTGGTQTDIILMRNPALSGKKIVILKIIYDAVTAAGRISFRSYFGPTVTTAGTSLTTVSRHFGGGAGASAATAFSGPSIAARGTQFSGPISVTGASNALPMEIGGAIVIEPGNDLLLTGVPDANNRLSGITLIWEEI